MRNRTLELVAMFSGLVTLMGCGAGAPAPAVASSADAKAQPKAAEPAPEKPMAAQAKAAEPEKPAPEAVEEARDGLRKASRPPLELLTGNNVVYVFNFNGSAKGEAAKARCEGSGDVAAARECLASERGKIQVESIRFVKDEHGQYWWVTYNRYKGNLLKWHKVQFMPGKEDSDTISLTLLGKDKGIAPMARVPASLKVELPNDYSIVVRDPEFGDMMYDAKIGLLEND